MYFLFSFWPLFAYGQVFYDFESGLDSAWVQWPEEHWECSPDATISGSYSLHHSFDNSSSGNDMISLGMGDLDFSEDISWEFSLRHGYLPSSSNKWEVYLASDKSAVEMQNSSLVNAFVLGVNVTGSDDTLRLYSLSDGKLSVLCTAGMNVEKDAGNDVMHFRILRSANAYWEIYFAREAGESRIIGSAQEDLPQMPALKNFLLSYKYTSSKDRLLWFDDLHINARVLRDTILPYIVSISICDANNILLNLSEDLNENSLDTEYFKLNPGDIKPDSIYYESRKISCHFSDRFEQAMSYSLKVVNLADPAGNILRDTSLEFTFYEAMKEDLVITEIMADPSPPVYLPESEYVEIYNRSGYRIDMNAFILQTGTKEWKFPEVTIDPEQYLVVSRDSIPGAYFVPIISSSTAISNEGQEIILRDRNHKLITASEFSKDWYNDDFKKEGGWSLERIDENNICGGKENWKASEDRSGGSPGRENSVRGIVPDISHPILEGVEIAGKNQIRLIFNENIDPSTVPPSSLFAVIPGIFPDSLYFPEYFCNYLDISFNQNFQKGQVYQLQIPDCIADCSGNPLKFDTPLRFGKPTVPASTDIIITEIMYSTLPGCPEYLEFYNQSTTIIDLSDLRMTISSKTNDDPGIFAFSSRKLIFPGDYIAVSRDKKALLDCHWVENPNLVIQSSSMPALPDDGACIKLMNRSLETIDYVCYDSQDQFPMLSDVHGISLERLSLGRETGDKVPWHSASSVSGFGTPAAENSQSLSAETSQNTLEVIPEIFSPDNDGRDDFAEIHYNLSREGYIGTVAVFDPAGRRLAILGENEILGTSGMFLWDGRDDSGSICRTGLYLVYAEFWTLKGEKKSFKKVVTLVRE
ncbi:MAG: lamin tail domain-containing protein [Bacteroidales bacterium]|nr:lamin tail domain-containing protein [Bacteroidales bacterium]